MNNENLIDWRLFFQAIIDIQKEIYPDNNIAVKDGKFVLSGEISDFELENADIVIRKFTKIRNSSFRHCRFFAPSEYVAFINCKTLNCEVINI